MSDEAVRGLFRALRMRYNSGVTDEDHMSLVFERMQRYVIGHNLVIDTRYAISDEARRFLDSCPCAKCFSNEACDKCGYNMPVNIWRDGAEFTFYRCRGKDGKHVCMRCSVTYTGKKLYN